MRTSIDLQDMYTYSPIPLIVTILLIVVITCYFIYLKVEKKKDNKIEVKKIPEKNVKSLGIIKSKYLKQLQEIENKYAKGKIDLRNSYQKMSETVRLFVFEVTDITTQNYSLSEIKKLNIPNLYNLIKEYYEPEFSSKSMGDFEDSIKKARRVIKEWN